MRKDPSWSIARVAAIRDVAPDIREITFIPEAGMRRTPAGAHVDVRVRTPAGEEIRSYSLVGAFDPAGYRIAVKHAPAGRGGSRHMWGLGTGGAFEVSAPVSTFELGPAAPQTLLIAGGIGITPILGMAAERARAGADYRLAYAGVARGRMAYLDELAATHGDRLTVHASAEGSRLDLAAAFAALHPDGETYLCGPMGMLDAAKLLWQQAGRHPARLRFETFGSSGHFPREAFNIRIPRLGREIAVPADMSMLDALEAAGIGVLAECRHGECGLCLVDVIATDGTIDHRDVFLSSHQRAENRKICACVSRVVGGSIDIDPAWRGEQQFTI